MTLKQLGSSDIRITPVGIGAWAMGGGKWEFGWGPQDDLDSMAAIHEGLNRGLNWIDTAAAYGLEHSETVAARAIKGLEEPPYVFTKCSLVWDDSGRISHNLQAESIRREAEASLERLAVERIDLHQIHCPAWKGQSEAASPGSIEEAMTALVALQWQGKVRRFGVSNFSASQMARAQEVAPITSLQPPYSLLARQVEASILPYGSPHRIGGHRLFADEFRALERDDTRAHCKSPGGRLAPAKSEFSGTADYRQPTPGRDTARDWEPAQHHAGSGRGHLDIAQPCGDGRHSGRENSRIREAAAGVEFQLSDAETRALADSASQIAA